MITNWSSEGFGLGLEAAMVDPTFFSVQEISFVYLETLEYTTPSCLGFKPVSANSYTVSKFLLCSKFPLCFVFSISSVLNEDEVKMKDKT